MVYEPMGRNGMFSDMFDDMFTAPTSYGVMSTDIHKKGIKPNVAVKDNEKTKTDEQLNRAISILKK